MGCPRALLPVTMARTTAVAAPLAPTMAMPRTHMAR